MESVDSTNNIVVSNVKYIRFGGYILGFVNTTWIDNNGTSVRIKFLYF